MGSTSKMCLSWSEFNSCLITTAQCLRQSSGLVDVTLSAGGRIFTAHRLVLSAASPLLMDLLKSAQCQHPIVMLAGVSAADLEAILEFIYQGEVNIYPEQLPSLLQAAQYLNIKALSPSALTANSGASEERLHIFSDGSNFNGKLNQNNSNNRNYTRDTCADSTKMSNNVTSKDLQTGQKRIRPTECMPVPKKKLNENNNIEYIDSSDADTPDGGQNSMKRDILMSEENTYDLFKEFNLLDDSYDNNDNTTALPISKLVNSEEYKSGCNDTRLVPSQDDVRQDFIYYAYQNSDNLAPPSTTANLAPPSTTENLYQNKNPSSISKLNQVRKDFNKNMAMSNLSDAEMNKTQDKCQNITNNFEPSYVDIRFDNKNDSVKAVNDITDDIQILSTSTHYSPISIDSSDKDKNTIIDIFSDSDTPVGSDSDHYILNINDKKSDPKKTNSFMNSDIQLVEELEKSFSLNAVREEKRTPETSVDRKVCEKTVKQSSILQKHVESCHCTPKTKTKCKKGVNDKSENVQKNPISVTSSAFRNSPVTSTSVTELGTTLKVNKTTPALQKSNILPMTISGRVLTFPYLSFNQSQNNEIPYLQLVPNNNQSFSVISNNPSVSILPNNSLSLISNPSVSIIPGNSGLSFSNSPITIASNVASNPLSVNKKDIGFPKLSVPNPNFRDFNSHLTCICPDNRKK